MPNAIFEILRLVRQEAGLSQSELGRLSGISLPSIQNIESGRANPAIGTLQALGDALGLRFSVVRELADWPLLAVAGLPLLVPQQPSLTPTPELFFKHLRLGIIELSVANDRADDESQLRASAMDELLAVLRRYFPTAYATGIGRSSVLKRDIIETASITANRRQQMVARLARFL